MTELHVYWKACVSPGVHTAEGRGLFRRAYRIINTGERMVSNTKILRRDLPRCRRKPRARSSSSRNPADKLLSHISAGESYYL